MKKDIWLKPGKELNTGAIIGGIGFAIYIALSALEWRGLALFAALAFGLEAGYAFLSALDCREKDKDSVSYNIVWGTGALAILMLLPLCRMKLREVYPPLFVTTVVATTCGTAAVIITCALFPGLT